jgi:hypothetical protein
MMCQRCGKACANRTEGRRVRLADETPFFCNLCSLFALADDNTGEGESIRAGLRLAPQRGNWLPPGPLAEVRGATS